MADMLLIVTGVGAGLAMGYALQRTKLALHGSFAGLPDRIPRVFRTWLLAVMIGVLGLTAVFASDAWPQLSRGLPFRPLPNIVGGLLLGFGMVLAVTTASGLFYNLGSGAVTCLVGLVGFMAGDAIGGWFEFPGDKGVLAAGEGATLPGVLDVPHWSVAVPLAVVVILGLAFWPVSPEAPRAWISWVGWSEAPCSVWRSWARGSSRVSEGMTSGPTPKVSSPVSYEVSQTSGKARSWWP